MANYDPTRNDLGYVRLLISDTADGEGRVFSDEEIGEVLKREFVAKAAASTLLLIIAGNENLLAKSIRTQDLQTDGPAVAAEMRLLAGVYRAQAETEVAAAATVDESPIVLEYPVVSATYPPELSPWHWARS